MKAKTARRYWVYPLNMKKSQGGQFHVYFLTNNFGVIQNFVLLV